MKLPNNQSRFFRTGPEMKEVKNVISTLKQNGWYESLKESQSKGTLKEYIHKYANALRSIEAPKEINIGTLLDPSDMVGNSIKVKLEQKFADITRGYKANQEAIRTGVSPKKEDLEYIALIA